MKSGLFTGRVFIHVYNKGKGGNKRAYMLLHHVHVYHGFIKKFVERWHNQRILKYGGARKYTCSM